MELAGWNPFAEDTFSELTEDALFGREFDRIKKSGSRSSESFCVAGILVCFRRLHLSWNTSAV
jgi:hypothetical protein